MPLVSIITPAQTHDERSVGWLGEAIESVLAQNIEDWEMIIINDHSKQSWKPLADLFKDERIHGAKSNHDTESVARARNQAAGMAQAKLLLPLDSDDKLAKNSVKRFLNAWEKRGKSGIIYSSIMMFDKDVRRLYKPPAYNFSTLLQSTFMIVGCLHLKSDWKKVGGWNPKLDVGLEDWEYWIKMGEHGVCGKHVDEVLYWYRRHAYGRIATLRATPTRWEQAHARMRELHRDTYNGRPPEMCCGGRVSYKQPPRPMMASSGGPLAGRNDPITNAVKMVYVGGRSGAFGMKGFTGRRYRVPGKNAAFDVDQRDVDFFRKYNHGRDFIMEGQP